MAGFNYDSGRSNNMVAAEERGCMTIGRWGQRYRVSAAAVQAIMHPHEAHHTGTGRRGKSRLTYVIDSAREPSAEQLAAMKEFDRAAKAAKLAPPVECVIRWLEWPTYSARLGRFRRGADRSPVERVSREEVQFDAAGVPLARGHRTGSGLVIAKDGAVLFSVNVRAEYESADSIARRICAEDK